MIVYATGFDAITGSFDRIDVRGEGGRTLKDKWKAGPKTFVGVMVNGSRTCSCWSDRTQRWGIFRAILNTLWNGWMA